MALRGSRKKFANKIACAIASNEVPNFTQAAVACGYSEKTARQQGSRLMKDPEVLAYINKFCSGPTDPAERHDEEERGPIVLKDAAEQEFEDPKDALLFIMNNSNLKLAADCGKALLPYYYSRKGDTGKKEEREEQAEQTRDSTPFKPRAVK
jgi:phage terminase small subunit